MTFTICQIYLFNVRWIMYPRRWFFWPQHVLKLFTWHGKSQAHQSPRAGEIRKSSLFWRCKLPPSTAAKTRSNLIPLAALDREWPRLFLRGVDGGFAMNRPWFVSKYRTNEVRAPMRRIRHDRRRVDNKNWTRAEDYLIQWVLCLV